MRIDETNNFTTNVGAICLFAAPTMLLLGDLLGFADGLHYWHYFFCKAALAFFVFAIFALVERLKPSAEKFAVIAGGTAIIGAVSGATLFSFAYLGRELEKSGLDPETIPALTVVFREVYQTMVFAPLPGLCFPIGLLALSIGLFRAKNISRIATVSLAFGAILFPTGRIPGILPVSIASDALLIVGLSLIGWQLLRNSKTKDKVFYEETASTVAL